VTSQFPQKNQVISHARVKPQFTPNNLFSLVETRVTGSKHVQEPDRALNRIGGKGVYVCHTQQPSLELGLQEGEICTS
ncbi:hypothetical protein AMECASPLE_032100, partial [Ameca splendens]